MRQQPSSRKYPRTARVNELLREVIAEELERLISDDSSAHLVTITGVDADQSLAQAIVYYTSLDDDTGTYLDNHRVALQRAIASQVRLKRTPQLKFKVDPAIVAGGRIEEILNELKTEQ